MSGSSERILYHLKSHGPSAAADLAAALAISVQAVRQQLDLLAAEGLLEHEDRPKGPGRPRRLWRLSGKGHGRFPDRHAALTAELIEAIRGSLGQAALDQLIAEREARAAAAYKTRVKSEKKLAKRVAALAALRGEEGYMARVEEDEAGFLLIEDHCPICAAAAACQGFCRSELSLFQTALGKKAKVERVEHLLSGARRCAYRITKAKTAG